ncbi:MAG: hypothetical protein Q8P81_02235 [Nanoarchaeota archaeon]|nr:hypothetical protein [Nanoarchaeota archaeon]
MKKLLTEWKKFINEATSDIAYHITSVDLLYKILKTDRFMTSIAKGRDSDEEQNKNRDYYLSLARSKMSKYFRNPSSFQTIIVLDGQKLSQKYKIVPVDYWGPRFPDSDEMEDRVLVNSPYIEKASDYIQEIHVVVEVSDEYLTIWQERLQEIQGIEQAAKNKNIQTYFYTNKRDFSLLNKKNSLSSASELIAAIKASGKEIPSSGDRYVSKYAGDKDLKGYIKVIKMIETEDYNSMENAKYSSIEGQILRQISMYQHDFIPHLSNEISNNRRSESARGYIEDIFSYMRAKKLKTIKDLGLYLQNELKRIYKVNRDKEK